eukprot:m.179568 g.179568  ORF g.179568 m.179568 type:complete len:634 (-) comp31980_c1_seq1:43-1944(-)
MSNQKTDHTFFARMANGGGDNHFVNSDTADDGAKQGQVQATFEELHRKIALLEQENKRLQQVNDAHLKDRDETSELKFTAGKTDTAKKAGKKLSVREQTKDATGGWNSGHHARKALKFVMEHKNQEALLQFTRDELLSFLQNVKNLDNTKEAHADTLAKRKKVHGTWTRAILAQWELTKKTLELHRRCNLPNTLPHPPPQVSPLPSPTMSSPMIFPTSYRDPQPPYQQQPQSPLQQQPQHASVLQSSDLSLCPIGADAMFDLKGKSLIPFNSIEDNDGAPEPANVDDCEDSLLFDPENDFADLERFLDPSSPVSALNSNVYDALYGTFSKEHVAKFSIGITLRRIADTADTADGESRSNSKLADVSLKNVLAIIKALPSDKFDQLFPGLVLDQQATTGEVLDVIPGTANIKGPCLVHQFKFRVTHIVDEHADINTLHHMAVLNKYNFDVIIRQFYLVTSRILFSHITKKRKIHIQYKDAENKVIDVDSSEVFQSTLEQMKSTKQPLKFFEKPAEPSRRSSSGGRRTSPFSRNSTVPHTVSRLTSPSFSNQDNIAETPVTNLVADALIEAFNATPQSDAARWSQKSMVVTNHVRELELALAKLKPITTRTVPSSRTEPIFDTDAIETIRIEADH